MVENQPQESVRAEPPRELSAAQRRIAKNILALRTSPLAQRAFAGRGLAGAGFDRGHYRRASRVEPLQTPQDLENLRDPMFAFLRPHVLAAARLNNAQNQLFDVHTSVDAERRAQFDSRSSEYAAQLLGAVSGVVKRSSNNDRQYNVPLTMANIANSMNEQLAQEHGANTHVTPPEYMAARFDLIVGLDLATTMYARAPESL